MSHHVELLKQMRCVHFTGCSCSSCAALYRVALLLCGVLSGGVQCDESGLTPDPNQEAGFSKYIVADYPTSLSSRRGACVSWGSSEVLTTVYGTCCLQAADPVFGTCSLQRFSTNNGVQQAGGDAALTCGADQFALAGQGGLHTGSVT